MLLTVSSRILVKVSKSWKINLITKHQTAALPELFNKMNN